MLREKICLQRQFECTLQPWSRSSSGSESISRRQGRRQKMTDGQVCHGCVVVHPEKYTDIFLKISCVMYHTVSQSSILLTSIFFTTIASNQKKWRHSSSAMKPVEISRMGVSIICARLRTKCTLRIFAYFGKEPNRIISFCNIFGTTFIFTSSSPRVGLLL